MPVLVAHAGLTGSVVLSNLSDQEVLTAYTFKVANEGAFTFTLGMNTQGQQQITVSFTTASGCNTLYQLLKLLSVPQ